MFIFSEQLTKLKYINLYKCLKANRLLMKLEDKIIVLKTNEPRSTYNLIVNSFDSVYKSLFKFLQLAKCCDNKMNCLFTRLAQ